MIDELVILYTHTQVATINKTEIINQPSFSIIKSEKGMREEEIGKEESENHTHTCISL
jgi:hypothetical protein